MNPAIRALVNDVTAALLLGLALALAMPQSYAGMISTDAERDRVKTLLERPEVAAGLEKMGVAPQQALARVDAMTPAEVHELATKLDAAAAGGQSSGTRDVLLVILVVLLVLLLV